MENSSKEKQIEEMAFNLIMATSPLGVKDLTKQFDYKTVVTDLYELYGWRKASEVAREIFGEIEKFNRPPLPECEPVYIIKASELAELKKKYTEEQSNDR